EAFVGATLTTLLDHSLLQRTVTEAGQPGYELIATVRAYCRGLLDSDRERGERIRRNHADRFAELALRIARELDRPERRATALTVAEQHAADLRATVGRLLELGQARRAVRIAGLLEDVWIRSGRLTELERTFARYLEGSGGADQVEVLELLGQWALRSGRARRAGELFARAARACDRGGDAAAATRIAAWTGMAQLEAGRFDSARAQLTLARG
ncbi:hypothetical protein ACW9HQ_45380, partial [Nocardia gipuzkoensis]